MSTASTEVQQRMQRQHHETHHVRPVWDSSARRWTYRLDWPCADCEAGR